MPTLTPGCTFVPRWRMMIAPAPIGSPPKAFTPRRLDCESRPLRELPPAFLCAMFAYPFVTPRALDDDVVDLELGIALAMPLMLLVMLAPAHLEDLQPFAAAVAEDGRFHRGAGNRGLAQLHRRAVAHQQHRAEIDLRPDVGRQQLHPEFFAGGNLVLLAAGLDDRIHRNSLGSGAKKGKYFKLLGRQCQNARRGRGAAAQRASGRIRGRGRHGAPALASGVSDARRTVAIAAYPQPVTIPLLQ